MGPGGNTVARARANCEAARGDRGNAKTAPECTGQKRAAERIGWAREKVGSGSPGRSRGKQTLWQQQQGKLTLARKLYGGRGRSR